MTLLVVPYQMLKGRLGPGKDYVASLPYLRMLNDISISYLGASFENVAVQVRPTF